MGFVGISHQEIPTTPVAVQLASSPTSPYCRHCRARSSLALTATDFAQSCASDNFIFDELSVIVDLASIVAFVSFASLCFAAEIE